MTRVGIVGAGIGGLALTHALAERGVDSVAYEASDEPGGVIDSRIVDGRVLEAGPQRLRLVDPIAEMVDDLGLRETLRTADDSLPLYVYADGDLRLVPRSLSAFLTTNLLSWRAKLRVLAEPLTGEADPEETIESLFVRKFGRETYDSLVHPIIGGTFGSNPARMPVGHALRGVVKLERRHGNVLVPAAKRIFGSSETSSPASFKEGLQQLPHALADEHEERICLETPVLTIQTDGKEVVVESADGNAEHFDHVVVTTPARETADIVEATSPESAAGLRELTYNPLVLVHLVSDVDARGFGYQVRRDESLRTLGVSWNASLFDRDGVYTAFLGGMDDPEILEKDDEEIRRIAADEFERVMGADTSDIAVVNVEKMPWAFPAYDTTWDALNRVDLPERVHLATNYTARMGMAARVREAVTLAERFAGEQ